MRKLQTELQKNKNLNQKLNFLQKAPLRNKIILQGAPITLDKTALDEILADSYMVKADEYFIFREFPSRHNSNTKDVILVMPRALGQAII